jgi:hypothetical protein
MPDNQYRPLTFESFVNRGAADEPTHHEHKKSKSQQMAETVTVVHASLNLHIHAL